MASLVVRIKTKDFNKLNEIVENENKKSEYKATQIEVLHKLLKGAFYNYSQNNNDFEFKSDEIFKFGGGAND